MRPSPCAVAAVFAFAALARAQDDGLSPLFNGRDLAGWVPVNVAPKTFVVKDGLIVCDGKPTGVMRTEKMYENFVLELEYMHLVPGGNAGLFVWSDAVTSPGVPFTRSVEVQILDGSNSETHTSHGDVFSIHGATMKPDRPHPRGAMRCLPSERRANPAGQWNHYRVTCNDGVIKLAVNGKEVSGGSQCRPRKGYICLESEGGVVHYRNIRLKELPSTNPKSEEVAEADEGFESIYTGVDLSGWRGTGGGAGHWRARDWTLVCDGGGGRLVTEKEYGDFVLIADWRLPAKENPRGEGEGAIELGGGAHVLPIARSVAGARPPAGWNRFVITVKQGAPAVTLNGQTVTEVTRRSDSPAKGPIALRFEGGVIEFANLYVLEPE